MNNEFFFCVGAEGFEPPTLPTYETGCSVPAMSSSIRFLLFHFFI